MNSILARPYMARLSVYSTPTVTGGIVFIGTNEDPIDRKGHLVVLADPSVAPWFALRSFPS